MEELTYHPVSVGSYPKGDGYIVANLTHVLACAPSNDDGYNECGKNHSDTQWAPYHTPAYIFK
jgi:hypothetical protein